MRPSYLPKGDDFPEPHMEAAHAASEYDDPQEGAGAVVVPLIIAFALIGIAAVIALALAAVGSW